MAEWNVKRRGVVHGAPWVIAASSGPDPSANDIVLVMSDGTVPAAQGDIPLGFVVDERPTDEPPEMTNVHGNGAIIEDTGASFTIDGNIFSDGDGTISQTEGGGVGAKNVVVGKALTGTEFEVNIYVYETEA